MAKLPKEYLVCAKKFDLDKKAPRLSIEDFVSLSSSALLACKRVIVKAKLRSSQHKRLMQIATEYGFKVSIDPLTVGVRVSKKVGKYPDNGRNNSLGKSISRHTIIDTDAAVDTDPAEGVDVSFVELNKSRGLPERDYAVEVIGKPAPPAKKKNKDRIVATPIGPMWESEWEALTFSSTKVITTGKFYFTGSEDPKPAAVVQQAYYDRVALAKAIVAKLPWQSSVRYRNALQFHICCEMTDEEVVNLAVNTLAQDELVKGYTVKK